MNKYIETLNSLMNTRKEKKKKEPTIKEKESFRNAWVSLAVESGFTGHAEQYLYEGFGFCGAEPFYAYLVQTDDQNATLATLFSGKCYGNDSNVTFRLVTHLLALMLNNNAPQNVLAPVIKRLPGACVNKEKKRLGTAEKTMEKYFFAKLMPNVTLCPLADIGIKPVFIQEFIALVSSVMVGIESSGSSKGGVAVNIGIIRQWIANYEDLQRSPSKNGADRIQSASTTKAEGIGIETEADQSKVDDIVCQKPWIQLPSTPPSEEVPNDMIAYFTDLLRKAGQAASAIRAESVQQKIEIDNLTRNLESEREKVRRANQQISEHQNTIANLRQTLSATENDAFRQRQAVEQRDAVIAEKDAEIAERIKMADILCRDRNKQMDEALQAMASKIRIEYRDFMDALDAPMSCDLGENLRLQLQSIFDILEKGGMKIK